MAEFPRTKAEALALLYLQNQKLEGLSPEEILKKYDEAHHKICQAQPKPKAGSGAKGGI